MTAPDPPLTGDALTAAVSDAMAGMHRRYYHRDPVKIKTQFLNDELLACIMGGIYTDVEKTLIELQRQPLVKETRNAFQDAMRERFIAEVERLSGRKVTMFVSDSHVGPDLEIELFMLAPRTDTP